MKNHRSKFSKISNWKEEAGKTQGFILHFHLPQQFTFELFYIYFTPFQKLGTRSRRSISRSIGIEGFLEVHKYHIILLQMIRYKFSCKAHLIRSDVNLRLISNRFSFVILQSSVPFKGLFYQSYNVLGVFIWLQN